MPFSARERRVLACLPDINPDWVGEVLGTGAQSVVRAYDAGGRAQVIKLPLFHVRRGVYARTMGGSSASGTRRCLSYVPRIVPAGPIR